MNRENKLFCVNFLQGTASVPFPFLLRPVGQGKDGIGQGFGGGQGFLVGIAGGADFYQDGGWGQVLVIAGGAKLQWAGDAGVEIF